VRRLVLTIAVGLSALALVIVGLRSRSSTALPGSATMAPASATFVGSEACAGCHAAEVLAWRTSQHAGAMTVATDATVLGHFDGASFTYAGVTSRFFRRDGRFYVRTDGADGRLTEVEVTHTFGLYPLQQYLVPMPGGRLQALGIAWDARPRASGGQRWFHLHPDERITSTNPLHWTRLAQNWNFMCADCHVTNLKKGYDAASRTFDTTWTELGVGCEACHGPASAHVSLMRDSSPASAHAALGLTTALDERRGIQWTNDAASGVPVRSIPRTSEREIEVCARCHARRSQITDAAVAGEPFADAFRAVLLAPTSFYADGQPRDEVYNYASFEQSRMRAKGVTCSDCHEPHTGKVRVPGNALCTRCHRADRFDVEAHTFHRPGTPAAACATCHMPASTYMVIDPRHDHSFRVPRPDRSAAFGVPDVCTSACHDGRRPTWAAAVIRQRTGRDPGGYQTFAEAFAAADAGVAGATARLTALAADASLPAIVRASAVERMQQRSDVDVAAIANLLGDADPLVRRAAVTLLGHADDETRLARLPALLADPIRTVRTEAALAILDLADRALPNARRADFDRAFDEFVAEQRFNADRPEAQTNLGQAWLQRSRLDDAEQAFVEAIRLDPAFVPAYVNLSDLYRLRHDEGRAERIVRDGLAAAPSAAVLRHALGLSLVRQHRVPDALPELARAVSLEPGNARYAYVYAVALHDTGRIDEARRVLRDAAARFPGDRAIAEAVDAFR
jgi:predicted CXXCH cytochrome family protein